MNLSVWKAVVTGVIVAFLPGFSLRSTSLVWRYLAPLGFAVNNDRPGKKILGQLWAAAIIVGVIALAVLCCWFA